MKQMKDSIIVYLIPLFFILFVVFLIFSGDEPKQYEFEGFGYAFEENDKFIMSSKLANALDRNSDKTFEEQEDCLELMKECQINEDCTYETLSECLNKEDANKLLGEPYVQPDAPTRIQIEEKCEDIETFYPELYEEQLEYNLDSKIAEDCCFKLKYVCEEAGYTEICEPMFFDEMCKNG